ncbi:MAG TPA: DNA polymerase ligase N-terminal domain-containing protein [Thermoproteota archaeon]|nr:DNA polymerase ligase N-terminal domain-containing protein [Thermoproteota archaeon]
MPLGKGLKGKTPIFVVHRHAATHLHYDLRLEMDGVLKSWAVPKEPPLKPGEKRLAIMVEDHPLDYASFEGVIEKGYGAGTVEIWDRGNYELITREKDRIEVKFEGGKLKGTYLLVRFKKAGENNWLFFKAKQGSASSDKT